MPDLLREVPIEWNKYASIGANVLLTGMMAGLSGGYAIYFTFGSILIAILFGLTWGSIIFNLDRFIISSLINDSQAESNLAAFTSRFLKALPRVVMAIFIGVIISRPLALVLFREPIQQQIYQSLNAPLEDVRKRMVAKEAEISSLNERLTFESTKINKLFDAYTTEVQGTSGPQSTGMSGVGPMAARRLAEYKQAEQEFLAIKAEMDRQLSQKQVELATLRNEEENLSRALRASQSGLLYQFKALSDLKDKDQRIALADIFITLLFIFLEISPVLFRVLIPIGPYDEMLRLLLRKSRDDAFLATDDLATNEINVELQQAINKSLDNSWLNPRKERLKQ